MKKKIIANSVGILAMCLAMVPGMTIYAKDTRLEEKAAQRIQNGTILDDMPW